MTCEAVGKTLLPWRAVKNHFGHIIEQSRARSANILEEAYKAPKN